LYEFNKQYTNRKDAHKMMQINDIRIRKILQDGRLRAVVSLTIDDSIAVHDIKLVQGDERMFVAMPSRRDESGTFRDIIHPINPEARNLIETTILKAYDDYLAAESTGESSVGRLTAED
jgi:stage V sporulation protein G